MIMCTSIAIGKSVTVGRHNIIARNEDCVRANWNKAMIRRDKPEYIQNSNAATDGIWTLGNGLQVPVPKESFAYTGMPDAAADQEATAVLGNRFFFEERGINERNFAISATNSLTTNEVAATADPFVTRGGIAECILPTLLLPQARSAVHAVELLGAYLAEYGASEPNGLLLADPHEAWYFEIGSAHHWIAVRIPADRYLVVTNSMRVHEVDLGDTCSVRHSTGLLAFVADHNLMPNPDPASFDFARAFGVLGVNDNVDRLWLAQSILTPSQKQLPRREQYPLFLSPDQDVSVEDVMRVLRATYAGTELEGKATRPIGYVKTAESHIITLDAAMPEALRGLIWQCVSTPLCAPFLPLFAAMVRVPDVYAIGGDIYGANSAYWAYRGLFVLSGTGVSANAAKVAAMWQDYEHGFVFEHPYVREALIRMHATAPQAAIDFAGRYSTGIAFDAVGIAKTTRNLVMTELTSQTGPPTSSSD
jgi:dipeptidase